MYRSRLANTLPRVNAQVEEAARAAGRDPSEVRLIGVTKGHPFDAVAAALEAGLGDLGENRTHELAEKAPQVSPGSVRWHMIGHVQRRQAALALEWADLIHSVDSIRLAGRVSRLAEERGREARILVQVNTSGEESKSGLPTSEVMEALRRIVALSHIRVEGLMTMAPFTGDEGVIRRAFSTLREIREKAGEIEGFEGRELSMGMSNDMTLAIEEGSTMVRVGTALFGERPG